MPLPCGSHGSSISDSSSQIRAPQFNVIQGYIWNAVRKEAHRVTLVSEEGFKELGTCKMK
jgi:hypothetical protein